MTHIKRDILPAISAHLSVKEITIILGPRQVGKTTLLSEISKNRPDPREEKPFF